MSTSERGMTLWEVGVEWVKGVQGKDLPESKIFNPLKANLGDFISIAAVGLSGMNFVIVAEIDEYERTIGNKTYRFADYILRNGDEWFTLRVNPVEDADPYSQKHFDLLLLYPDAEFEYNENLHKNVLPTGVLEVRDESGNVIATYQRLGGLTDPHEAKVTALKDRTKTPEVEHFHYWDFCRANDGTTEYYFVEMNKETGWFQMFRGVELFEKDVLLTPHKKD